MLPEHILNIVRLIDSARYTILYCGYTLLLSPHSSARSSPYALLLEVVDVHTDKHIAASNEALDCLMLQLSQPLLLGSGDEVGASLPD